MERFIVRFRGSAAARDIVARLSASPELTVVEETPRMVLVEGPEDELRNVVGASRDFVIVPERHYEHPKQPLNIKKK